VVAGRLTARERGLVVHRALQRLGRGPAGDLPRLAASAMREQGLAGHDPTETQAIVDLLRRYMESETWRVVRTATALRTEVAVVAPFEEGVLEGQADALAIDGAGGLHLIDYKTGREGDEGTEAEHVFQVGAYAAALARCRGELPVTATVHYTATGRRVEVPVAEAAQEAKAALGQAMRAIRAGDFPPRSECDPAECGYGWACLAQGRQGPLR